EAAQLIAGGLEGSRFADGLSLKDGDLVRADDQGAGVARGDHGGLLARQAQRQFQRGLVGAWAFVDLRGFDGKGQLEPPQQSAAVGRAGSQYERHGGLLMNARQFTVSGSGRRRQRGVGATDALTLGLMIEYHLEFSRATNFMVIDAAGFARAGQSLDGVTQ